MRFGLAVVGAVLFGALLAHFLLLDKGYVLVNFRGYVVEMSVPALVVVLAVFYLLVRIAIAVWRAPRRFGEALADRGARKSATKLTRGLIHLSEGDWARGERLLTHGIKRSDAPLANYLMAARAAQMQGSAERRNEWLKLAFEELPEAATAVLLTQAELQFENGEYEHALATLQSVTESDPAHPVALALLAQTYNALRDFDKLRELLPKLRQAQLSPEQCEALAIKALRAIDARSDLDAEQLKRLWTQLSPELRQAPSLSIWRAQQLERLGLADQAESELRAALKRQWVPALVDAYGQILSADPRKQLQHAENWLKDHAEDAGLLVTAARLCLANELWGKARSYLESSLAIAPTPSAYALYGRLLAQLGDAADAADAYRAGLGMVSEGVLDVPALAAPPDQRSADIARRG